MASNQRGCVSTLPPIFKLLTLNIMITTETEQVVYTKRFYKENDGRWYIDLPEYIEAGVGTKANLQMVAGADKWLDKLSGNTNDVTVIFSGDEFEGYEDHMFQSFLFPADVYVDDDGEIHDDLSLGKWYTTTSGHQLWLCPVTLYVFGGTYPQKIYYSVNK